MPSSHVTPVLPSGKHMQELDLPAVVVEQVETLALQILQRNLGPIVQRRRGRRARQNLLNHLLETAYRFSDLETAVEHALVLTSALGQCLPGLDEDELARILTYKAASGSGIGPTSPLLSGAGAADNTTPDRSRRCDDEEREDLDAERGRSQTRAPTSDVDDDAMRETETGVLSTTATAAPTPKPAPRPTPPAISPEKIASAAAVYARTSIATHAGGALIDVEALATVRDAIRRLIKERVTFTAYLDGEKIQWAQEPAQQVLVLVTGAVLRAAPHPPVDKAHDRMSTHNASTVAGTTHARSRLSSAPFTPAAGVTANTRRDSGRIGLASGTSGNGGVDFISGTNSGRRPSSALDAQVRQMMSQAAEGGDSGQGTDLAATKRRTSTVLKGIAVAVAAGKLGAVCEETLDAPLVLGEAACLGGFPVCADLVVHSPVAIVAVVPRADYVALIECAPRAVQQQLLSRALQERERLLPYYAPMTLARLRLCPLLHNLKKDELEALVDYVQPRVFPANAVCSERSDPQHIFFIRRGAVRMEREQGEPSALSAQSYQQMPRSRALLVDGHTYGEAACIFRESLGGTYFAVSHVDAYTLPFAVLIRLMKQLPDAQSKVYESARLLTAARESEVSGLLFSPPEGAIAEGSVTGLSGVVPPSSVLFRRSSNAAQRTLAAQQQQLLQHSARLSLSGAADTRCVSFAVDAAPPSPLLGAADRDALNPNYGTGTAAAALTASGTGPAGAAAVLDAVRRIPLLNVIGTTAFFNDLAHCWRAQRVEKGEYVVRRGEECNRLLIFCQGRAGVIVDERRYIHDLQSCPFGIPDVDSISASALVLIPVGFAAGYTCVRRHRWTRSVVALDDNVEVLEVTRAVLMQLLQRHKLERALAGAALQIMQPLACVFSLATNSSAAAQGQSRRLSATRPPSAGGAGAAGRQAGAGGLLTSPSSRPGSIFTAAGHANASGGLAVSASAVGEMACPRIMALDYQPLLRPSPNSIWSCHPVPNLHPVAVSNFSGPVRDRILFPMWKDGDFPLPGVSTTLGGGADARGDGLYSSDQSMPGSQPVSRRATRSNMQLHSSDASPLTTPGASVTAGGTHRLSPAALEMGFGSAAGSSASSPLAPSALARAEFQRRVQQEAV